MSNAKSYTSKIASNGQLVIPKELRDSLGVKGGDIVLFLAEKSPSGVLKVILRKPSLSFSSMVGAFSNLKGRSTQEILQEIDDEEMK